MIEKKTVCQIVEEWLEGKDYFLVEVTVSPDDKIVVEIDHAEGVWIEDCVELSRFIESKLNREEEDYELEVGSAGIGQPFKVLQQYYIHIGQEVEVVTRDGRKLAGILKDADEEKFTVGVEKKVKLEGSKRSKLNREEEDYELEVGSAGIGQPFKVLQQYYIHIGQEVEVVTRDGRKLAGILKDADEEKFTVGVEKKVKLEGSKRPKLIEEDETFTYEQIKYTKYLISFK